MHPLLNVILESTDKKIQNELYFQMTEDIVLELHNKYPNEKFLDKFPNGVGVAVYKILYTHIMPDNGAKHPRNVADKIEPIQEIIYRRYFDPNAMKIDIFVKKPGLVSFQDPNEFKFKIYRYKTEKMNFLYYIYEDKKHINCVSNCENCPNRLVILMK